MGVIIILKVMVNDAPIFSSEEEKLKDSLKRYQAIIDSTPICIKVFDDKGNLLFINKGGRQEHFIKDTDDIAKWDWVGTVKDEYKKQVTAAFQAGLKGVTSRVIMEHTPEGSTHQWCEGIISPIKGADGKVAVLLFYSVDITKKKMAEMELEKKERDLLSQNEELERMNKLMVGRELRIAELKERLKKLGGDNSSPPPTA